MTKGIWSPSENGTIQDMKCCSGPVDQVLSEMLFGLENKDGGPKGVNQTWNAQCSGNHVVTGEIPIYVLLFIAPQTYCSL